MDVNTLLKGTLTVVTEEEKSQLHFMHSFVPGGMGIQICILLLPVDLFGIFGTPEEKSKQGMQKSYVIK